MRRASALLAGLGAALVVCLAPSSASALVPYDRVLFVSAALSDAPWAGAHGSRVMFLHPKDMGGVLIELNEFGAGEGGHAD